MYNDIRSLFVIFQVRCRVGAALGFTAGRNNTSLYYESVLPYNEDACLANTDARATERRSWFAVEFQLAA
eukprot:IDg15839t1